MLHCFLRFISLLQPAQDGLFLSSSTSLELEHHLPDIPPHRGLGQARASGRGSARGSARGNLRGIGRGRKVRSSSSSSSSHSQARSVSLRLPLNVRTILPSLPWTSLQSKHVPSSSTIFRSLKRSRCSSGWKPMNCCGTLSPWTSKTRRRKTACGTNKPRTWANQSSFGGKASATPTPGCTSSNQVLLHARSRRGTFGS